MIRYLSIGTIGEKRSVLQNKSLLCKDVPIANLNPLRYLPSELHNLKDEDKNRSIIYVHLSEEDIFNPETMASFEGATVTLDHPPIMAGIHPDNYKQFTVGHVENVRRGTGDNANALIADLLIKDTQAIEAVLSNQKRQVSIGYDGDVVPLDEPGVYGQKNIRANHVAIVARGRGGEALSIQNTGEKILSDLSAQNANEKKNTLIHNDGAEVNTADTTPINNAAEDQTQAVASEPQVITNSTPDNSCGSASQNTDKKPIQNDDVTLQILQTLQAMVEKLNSLSSNNTITNEAPTAPALTENYQDTAGVSDEEIPAVILEEVKTTNPGDPASLTLNSAAQMLYEQTAAKAASVYTSNIFHNGLIPEGPDAISKFRNIVRVKRNVITNAMHDSVFSGLVTSYVKNPDEVNQLNYRETNRLFNDIVNTRKALNNNDAVLLQNGDISYDRRHKPSIAEINERNTAFWDKNKKATA